MGAKRLQTPWLGDPGPSSLQRIRALVQTDTLSLQASHLLKGWLLQLVVACSSQQPTPASYIHAAAILCQGRKCRQVLMRLMNTYQINLRYLKVRKGPR